jgi:ABC-type uncharacterized transport system permease subunit
MSETPPRDEPPRDELPRAVAVRNDPLGRLRVSAELQAAAIALLATIAAGSVLIIFAGASPVDVWSRLVSKTFGNEYGLGQVIFRATPLVFTALAVSVPMRAGLVNIGGEGQMVAAALGCAVVAAGLPAGTPMVLALPIALVAAAAFGGAVGAATGALRVYRGAHEVIVAILLNEILGGVVLWLGNAWLFVGDATRTAPVVAGARFPELGITGSSASLSVAVALLAAVAAGWVQTRSVTGYRWRMIGAGPEAALAAGIDVARQRVWAMAAAGALAGLAGAHFVLGNTHAFEYGMGRNVGFMGIAVALLAQGRASAILVSAMLFGALGQGGIEVSDLVPKEMVDVLQAVVVIVTAATLGRRDNR